MSPATRIVLAAAALGAALTVGLWLVGTPLPWGVRAVGATTMFSSFAPGLKYLAERPSARRPVPLLPVVGLIYGIYFGVPFAFGVPGSPGGGITGAVDPSLMMPALLALLGWLMLLGAYWEVGQLFRPRPWNLSRIAPNELLPRAGVALMAVGLALQLTEYVVPVPAVAAGVWTLLGRLGWVGAGFLVAAWSRGVLGRRLKLFALIGILAVSVLEIVTGLVANPGRFWLVLLISAWIGRGRSAPARWWISGAAVVLVMIVLRGAMSEYRQQAWYGADLGPTERVATLSTILAQTVEAQGVGGLIHRGAEIVGERTSQAAVLADVVQRTPASVPYWGGETYLSLVGAVVPRFLWPSKPVKNLGQRFGHRYSYLAPDDRSTSFNLPFLVEFYANFGALGIIIGMALVGGLYRVLDDLLNRPQRSQILVSVLALGLLVPVMTHVEGDFSLVFGGLILNGIALYGILRLLTRSEARARSNVAHGGRIRHSGRTQRTISRSTGR